MPHYSRDWDDLAARWISAMAPRECMPGSYLNLVAAIIRSGLKDEGPEYLRTRGGQYWCLVSDLDPATVRELAVRHYSLQEQGFPPPGSRVEESAAPPS